jgi:hypothetical protein
LEKRLLDQVEDGELTYEDLKFALYAVSNITQILMKNVEQEIYVHALQQKGRDIQRRLSFDDDDRGSGKPRLLKAAERGKGVKRKPNREILEALEAHGGADDVVAMIKKNRMVRRKTLRDGYKGEDEVVKRILE